MRTSRYLATAAITALLAAAFSTAAHAAAAGNVLTYGSLGGAAVANGDTLNASLKSGTAATFMSSSGGSTGITCTVSNFSGTVGNNPLAPGVATGTLNVHNFSSCTENITGVLSVQSITVNNLPFDVAFDSVTNVVTVTGNVQTTVVLNTLLGRITCQYQANGLTVTGSSSNTDNSMNFTNQQFNKTSGPSLCFNNAYWTASYAPVTGAGGQTVFVN